MAKDYGNLDMEGEIEEWNNPCEDYISWKKDPPLDDEDGVGEDRVKAMRRVIIGRDENGNENDVEWSAWDQFHPDWQDRGDPETDGQLSTADGLEYYNHLRDHLSKSSVYIQYMPIIQDFLNECKKRRIIDANPAAYALDQAGAANSNKNYPEITVAQWGKFFKWLGDPQLRAMLIMMAKTAIRAGEVINIDLPFLNLDHKIYGDYLDSLGVELVDEVKGNPDSLYIPSEPEAWEEFRGEVRKRGNKTTEGKLLPIDRELKRVLLDWISMRPNIGYPHPLFTDKSSSGRVSKIRGELKENMREYGIAVDYIDNEGEEKKDMSCHYFRHFFSTNMQDGQGTYDGADWPWSRIKIIRGDITDSESDNKNGGGRGDNLQNVYTHNWGDLIREPYLRDIYNFGLYKPERKLST